MRILGIDPGYDRLGIAIIEQGVLIHSECFSTSSKDNFQTRLMQVGQKIHQIIKEYEPEILAIESLFVTKNQKTAMKVAEVRGVITYESMLAQMETFEYSPPEIKLAVTGHGGSDKSQIIKMIPLLLKIKVKKALDDEYDAIAVALTCDACIKNNPSRLSTV